MTTRYTRWLGLAAAGLLALGAGVEVAAEAIAPYQVIEVSPGLEAGEGKAPAMPKGMAVARNADLKSVLGPITVREAEPNGTPGTATPLGGSSAVVFGNVYPNNDLDYFSFTGAAGDRVYAATQTSFSASASVDSVLVLYGTDGTTVIEQDLDDGSFGSTSSTIAGATLPADGTFYLLVRHNSTTSQLRPYNLYFRLRSGTPTAETEPNDAGQALPAGGWVSGDTSATTDVDIFTFDVNAGDTVFLSLDLDPERDATEWNGTLGMGPFDAFVLVVNDGGTATPDSEAFFMTVKDAGPFYAYVAVPTGGTTFGTYHLSVTVFPASNDGLTCTTYTSTDVPQTIPDGPGQVTSTITIPGNPRIADLDVAINLTHNLMVDLDVNLVSPAGNDNGLFNDIGASTVGGVTAMNLVVDDEGAIPLGLYTVLSGMHFQPELNYRLSWFDGEDAGGTWTLTLRDDLAVNGGTLNGWSITVCEPAPLPQCPAGFDPVTVYSSDFELDEGGFTHTGTADEWERGLPSFIPITTCNSGSNCWKTDLDNTYNASSIQDLLSPVIDLTGLSGPVLVSWAQRYHIETASYDHAYVDFRWADDSNPTRLFEWLGASMNATVGNPSTTINESAGWALFTADMSAYAGQQTELVFHLDTDSSVQYTGFAIDDVTVTACEPVAQNPAISLSKTVGTDPLVCAPGDSIVVAPGTGVTYCFSITNTGDVELTLHDLVDDHLGGILSGFPYALTPGASAFITMTTTITSTTVNTATWTAYNAGPSNVVTATDTATVTVEVLSPSIVLSKTVGTIPGVCAATDNIAVAAGTEVYYCYQTQNTGNVTFELHDLVDDHLGTVLNNLPYTLAPGAFSPQVIVPKTITVDTINTATWTAKTLPFTPTVFNFVDITTTGTALNLTDDSEANITLPFAFTLFGQTSSDLRVANNGGILFGVTTGDLGTTNAALPNAAIGRAILPFWDDIDSDTGNVYWEVQGTAPNRVAIIEWYNRPHFSNIGAATFEVLLYEGTNAITFQYLDTDFGDPLYNAGVSATVGLNDTASNALQYSFNQANITDLLALTYNPATFYTASSTDTATVDALFPNIDVSPLSLASTQVPNTVNNVPVTIANTGQAPLDWEILETEPDRPANPGVQPAPEPVFNVPAAVTSKADCEAFENYLGREPEGYAEFCGGAVEGPGGGVPDGPTDIGYLINLRTPDRNLKQFVLNNFPGQVVIGPQAANIYGMDFNSTATTLYALNSTTNELGTLNIATGAFTSIVACPAPGGGSWTDLSIDPATDVFYASTATNLYTLDPATCSPVLVGPFGVPSGIMIDLAVNTAGQMYGHDIFTDSIYTIDTTTGAATLVGLTTYLANFAQGMDFDNQDGTLYIFLYIGTGSNVYGTVNLATGAVTPLAVTNPSGEFEGATQTPGICIPTDYSWLTINPVAGTTPPAGSTPVNAAFDSTGLAVGTYTGQVCVRSNDPDAGPGNGSKLVVVPVTLEVVPPQNPAISLAKTVGTTPGVCAATSSIVVAAGTTVYYCYEVTNTGDVALNLHDLADDVLGTIFTGLNYALAPGASVNTVQAGLSIPYVANSTTTNTGTWTAYNAGPINLVTATASATVTVELLPDIEVAPVSLFSSQMTNTQVVQQLTIGNTGGGDLTWTLSEEGLPLSTARFTLPAGQAQAPQGTAVAAAGYTARPAGSYTVQRHAGVMVPPDVMLLAADDDNDLGSPIQTLLVGYGDLGAVDLFDPRTTTPTLGQLQAYDVVVVWSNYLFADATAIGNVLADYVDAGGEVIDMMFALDPGWGYQGRFRTEGYSAMTTTSYTAASLCLGTYNAGHPIMAGVTNVCEYYRALGTALTAGSSEVARWSDNELFVAVKDNGSVATLNAYVGANYQWTGQMPDVLHNAILWISGAGTGCTNLSDVPWLSASPTAGTTPPAGSTPVDVTFDSTGIAVGTYNANLCAFSNDPDEPIVPVPVTMEVVIPVELMGISIE